MSDGSPEIVYPRLSERVYEYLCNQVIEGSIRYGERVSIKALSERLKVSTMPVRDALKMLETEGVVQIIPRSSCVFKVPTKKSILDAFAMREMLELQSMEAIYAAIGSEDLACLAGIVQTMGRALEGGPGQGDIRRYIDLDRAFHTELCALSRNDYLVKFYREVNLHLNMTFTYRIGAEPDIEGTYADHRKIVELLRERSPAVLDLLKGHLRRSRQEIVKGRLFQSLE